MAIPVSPLVFTLVVSCLCVIPGMSTGLTGFGRSILFHVVFMLASHALQHSDSRGGQLVNSVAVLAVMGVLVMTPLTVISRKAFNPSLALLLGIPHSLGVMAGTAVLVDPGHEAAVKVVLGVTLSAFTVWRWYWVFSRARAPSSAPVQPTGVSKSAPALARDEASTLVGCESATTPSGDDGAGVASMAHHASDVEEAGASVVSGASVAVSRIPSSSVAADSGCDGDPPAATRLSVGSGPAPVVVIHARVHDVDVEFGPDVAVHAHAQLLPRKRGSSADKLASAGARSQCASAPTRARDWVVRTWPGKTVAFWALVAGSCSGFLGGVVALSGPPMMVFVAVMGLHHSEVRATLVAVDSVAMSVQTAQLVYDGVIVPQDWLMYLGTTVGAVLGMLLGNFLHHRVLTPTRATGVVLFLLSLSAVTLVGQAEPVRMAITAGAFAVVIALVYAAVALHARWCGRRGASASHERMLDRDSASRTKREGSMCCGPCAQDDYHKLRGQTAAVRTRARSTSSSRQAVEPSTSGLGASHDHDAGPLPAQHVGGANEGGDLEPSHDVAQA